MLSIVSKMGQPEFTYRHQNTQCFQCNKLLINKFNETNPSADLPDRQNQKTGYLYQFCEDHHHAGKQTSV